MMHMNGLFLLLKYVSMAYRAKTSFAQLEEFVVLLGAEVNIEGVDLPFWQ